MDDLHLLELIILLMVVVLALTAIAEKLLIPYPILLVIGGLALTVMPGLPVVHLDPELVFLVFLPPILWAAAYFTSFREFRANLRPIGLLAVGLVLVTTAAVAAVARALLPDMGWPAAIALGAIVSPPDAVSAVAVAKRLHIPRRLVTILEGESLVNDATALVLYRAAVVAVLSGRFLLGETLLEFAYAATVGIAVGLAVAGLAKQVLKVTKDSFTEIAITLLAPYIAWVFAEQIHASGVLACVAGGLYVRRYFSTIVAPMTRIQARAVWELLIFLLNGVIFILIGLQLSALQNAVAPDRLTALIVVATAVSATVILMRVLWVPLVAVVSRVVSPSLRKRDPLPPWSHLFIIGWTGMRGIVTLAAALAIPLTTATGAPFPFREEIILISFGVILATLVLQGLSLTPLIRALHVEADQSQEGEERHARVRAAEAALAHLDRLAGRDWLVAEHLDQMRSHYGRRMERYAKDGQAETLCTPEEAAAFRRLRHETLTAERLAVIRLRNEGTISDELLHRLEHELDVEALRHGLGEQRVSMMDQHT
ncbi:MAG: Na+/H+ antiporter [Nitrospiraceae bacterium]